MHCADHVCFWFCVNQKQTWLHLEAYASAAALMCLAFKMYEIMVQVLDFMSRQFGEAGPEANAGEGGEVASFRKVHATIKYLADHVG